MTGLVIEEIRKIESLRTGAPPIDKLPISATCTSSCLLTSATMPGTSPRST